MRLFRGILIASDGLRHTLPDLNSKDIAGLMPYQGGESACQLTTVA